MAVTVADVVRTLIAHAPSNMLARPWLEGLLPGLDVAAEVQPPRATAKGPYLMSDSIPDPLGRTSAGRRSAGQ